jgi:hypothetical protein
MQSIKRYICMYISIQYIYTYSNPTVLQYVMCTVAIRALKRPVGATTFDDLQVQRWGNGVCFY